MTRFLPVTVMNEIKIEAKIENISAVQDFVNVLLADCPPKIQNKIAIAVDEVFSNIARYAYYPEVGEVTVRVAASDEITIEFEDSGAAYDPLAKDDPDVSLSAEERDLGGLGIFMLKNIMDSVEYRRDGDRNILTIRKALE